LATQTDCPKSTIPWEAFKMSKYYLSLFQPIKIGSLTLKNRLVVPPMGTGFAAEDGTVTDRLINYHEARAKGGFALITMEVTAVDGIEGKGSAHQLSIFDDRFIPGFKRLVDRIHDAGAKVGVQLYHPGRVTLPAYIGGLQPVGPSSVPDPVWHQDTRELTVQDIAQLVESFAQGARRAKEAGFDIVELHGAHGYLISQFMSGYANKRTDEYGGGFDGFIRFPVEIIRRVRQLVGPDFPVFFRISGDELVPMGRTVTESVEAAKRLIQEGVNVIDVSIGVMESSAVTSAPPDMEQGFNAVMAAAFKKALSVPVIAVGRINDPDIAEEIISSGKADLVAIGRQSLTDPEWPNKIAEGRKDDIVKCISCNEGCIEGLAIWRRPMITCVQNLALGKEAEYVSPHTSKRKKVLIAGGGPAGMEAARTATLWGHEVILYEKDKALGGQVNIAVIPPKKDIYKEVTASRVKAIKELGVEIHLGEELSPDIVKQIAPDVLIIATGSKPLVPKISGIDRKNVITAAEALREAHVGDKVVVVGGGLVGCETADYLAQQGKEVTIVEMLRHTARDIGPAARYFLRRRLAEKGIKILTSTTVEEVIDGGVRVKSGEGSQLLSPVDTVVLATGAESVNELGPAAKGIVPEVYVIGDAAKPGKIMAAVEQAAELARQL
jgi:2,4-dienoyl-CoA reductase-like NADH-dependent reductase (Old Yellow Enzyme family)/thioredoxin reductase